MLEHPMHAVVPASGNVERNLARTSRQAAWSWERTLAVLLAVLTLAGCSMGPEHTAAGQKPNILFIIMDDVGIDQMPLFGYGGATPPSMPTIDQVADAGLRFTNTWSMPACTTSRSVFFSGRFPLRTNVYGALGPDDLANSQVSPFETTTPKLLKERGYQSALFGKFHLGLPGHNPFGYAMVRSLGWDYFYGWLDESGDPSSIDTTAGGVASANTWSCGFVPGAVDGGADEGACYAADNTCQDMQRSGPIPPGRTCRDRGGIFAPHQQCQNLRPANIDFATLSGHYVSPLVINHEDGTVERVPPTDIRARTYRGTAVVDAAIDWIKRQPKHTPWMASVSFSSAHTPVMHPPPALLAAGAEATSGIDCRNTAQQRILTNQMIEAMDTEIGRLLVDTEVARHGPDGRLHYRPDHTDTMIIVVGDNGTFGSAVKLPFDSSRAKGSAYQTGVWVPLVVAGPLVTQPDRDVPHMVNIADLYQLFGEIAGIDVPQSVPRIIDAVALLPYLVNPSQASIRQWNFTQVGPNLQANGSLNGPCTIGPSCTQIPVTKSVCEDNGGIWWGEDATDPLTAGLPPEGLTLCCEVNVFLTQHTPPGQTPVLYALQPLSAVAIRNNHYKIVRNALQDYDPMSNACVPTQTDEFYQINEAVPVPMLDRENADLKAQGPLTPRQQANYDALSQHLDAILASYAACPGDGNIDGVVNRLDRADGAFFAAPARGQSSWYDFNLDGLTDAADLQIIRDNLGACP